MKKILTIFLAAVIVACLCITALAYDGTTVITVEIPETTASYIFNYPAAAELVYGDRLAQKLGDLSVRELKDCSTVTVQFGATDLINVDDSTDTIAVVWWPDMDKSFVLCDEGAYIDRELYARVDDWSAATAGATYQATVSYVVSCS